MYKVFIVAKNGEKYCINVDNTADAANLRESGGEEVPQEKVEAIFGDLVPYVSPDTTLVNDDGSITFTPPDVNAIKLNELRSKRNEKLADYDTKINQLQRILNLSTDNEEKELIKNCIHAWYNYANTLCNLPQQDGAPWDGGGSATPWPDEPVMPVI